MSVEAFGGRAIPGSPNDRGSTATSAQLAHQTDGHFVSAEATNFSSSQAKRADSARDPRARGFASARADLDDLVFGLVDDAPALVAEQALSVYAAAVLDREVARTGALNDAA